jgi:hypothetical protein
MVPANSVAAGGRRRKAREDGHSNPRTGAPCNGTLFPHHLGHEFLTDVVELRFEGPLASSSSRQFWLSLLYALLEGAAQSLNIRRDDIDGTLYYHAKNEPPALVLYDNVPGGAGHVKRIADELPIVFRGAFERVNTDCCGAETSCYECLRNYRN